MISFDELDLMMQQKNGASEPEKSPYARDFLDYMSQVTSNPAGYAGDSHAKSNTELKPLTNFELSRVASIEDSELNQPYEIQNMNIDLGKGGKLPDSFEVGLRPQYELDRYV